MLPVELGEPTARRLLTNMDSNDEQLRVNLDVLEERRGVAAIRNEAQKRMVARRYNTKVRPRQFVEGDLVWRKTTDARKKPIEGKLTANWEGPFKIHEDLGNGAYRLQLLTGDTVPNTWNAINLKLYFS